MFNIIYIYDFFSLPEVYMEQEVEFGKLSCSKDMWNTFRIVPELKKNILRP